MKKLTLAAAISLLATSGVANALTVYEKNGFKYTVKGDIQVQLLKQYDDNDQDDDDEELDVNYDDAELKNRVTYDVGNGTKAFAQVDYDFRKEATEETYVGLDFGGFKFWVGDSDYVTDDFDIEANIDVIDLDGDAFLEDDGDDLIGASFKMGAAKVAFSHDLEVGDGEETSTDLLASIAAGPVDLNLGYQAYEVTDEGVTTDADVIGISGAFKISGIKIGLSYSVADGEEGTNDLEFENTHISLGLPIAPTTNLWLGYDVFSTDIENTIDEEVKSWYVNAIYKFPAAKNVRLFAEIANTDEDDSELGYLLGMRVKF